MRAQRRCSDGIPPAKIKYSWFPISLLSQRPRALPPGENLPALRIRWLDVISGSPEKLVSNAKPAAAMASAAAKAGL
jgi:hypothetical protein